MLIHDPLASRLEVSVQTRDNPLRIADGTETLDLAWISARFLECSWSKNWNEIVSVSCGFQRNSNTRHMQE